jgi:NagD protein
MSAAHPSPAALARLRRCRGFLIDMDGTIYIDNELVPGARELLAHLDAGGCRYVFVTNNSSARARDYHARLAKLGIHVEPAQVITSGDATLSYLRRHTSHRSAYVVGTPAFEDECRDQGLDIAAADPDCVVVAFDKTLTFAKLERTCELLFAGKPYYATHPDKTCITTRGLIPDIAAIIAACEAVTGRLPKIIGKPYPEMVDAALERLGSSIDDTVIIGDQLDTDMAMAAASRTLGILMMSGETTRDSWATPGIDEDLRLSAPSVAQVWQWLAGK